MTKPLKKFEATRGLALDGDWKAHLATCERCRQFDPQRPATAAVMCLEGAVLYKRDNPSTKPRQRAERSDTYATKEQVKRAMRYRE